MRNLPHNTQKGFTVLYALLMSSLLLSIGLGIYDISLRSFSLAAIASESQTAIFAADAGLECALYWDVKANSSFGIFATSSFSVPYGQPAPCAQEANILAPAPAESRSSVIADSQGATTTFYLRISSPNALSIGNTGTCAIVQIGKSASRTIVDSRGYNTCEVSSPRRVERGLRVSY